MRRIDLIRTLPYALALLAAGVFPAAPSAAQEQSLKMEMKLELGSVSLGEPIVLDYSVINPTSSEAYVFLGDRGKGWLTVDLVDEAGRKMPAVTVLTQLGKQALQGRAAFISPRSRLPGHLVVNQWFTVPRPVSYRLTVRARLNYVLGPNARQVPADVLEKGSETVLTEEYSFPLTVARTDRDRLRTISEMIRSELSTNPPGWEAQRLVDALFSIPSAYASPSWKTLVNDPGIDAHVRSAITGRLALFPSVEAADFLSWLVWDSKIPERAKPGVKNKLQRFYFEGNAAVKQHVGKIFIAREGKTPSDYVEWSSY